MEKRQLKKVSCIDSGIVYSSTDECVKALNLKNSLSAKFFMDREKPIKNEI